MNSSLNIGNKVSDCPALNLRGFTPISIVPLMLLIPLQLACQNFLK